MTLTIELIQDIVKVHPCTKYLVRRSNGSVVRALTDTHTHREGQTDGTDSITSTASLTREVKIYQNQKGTKSFHTWYTYLLVEIRMYIHS